MPDLLFLVERANEIGCLRGLGRGRDKNSKLRRQASVGKRQLIGDVDDVGSYTVLHNSTYVLRRGPPGSSVVENICLIGEEAKGHARRDLETME